jgi:hypothetical protein
MVLNLLEMAADATRREQRILASRPENADRVVDLPDKLGAIQAAAAVFERHGLSFALIGGLAVGIRSGVPRATLDVDFAVPTDIDRTWLRERFVDEGFAAAGSYAHSDNFQHSSGEPVQLAFDPQFDLMIERAETMTFGILAVRVVTKTDLIAMKRRAAADPAPRRSKSLRDQADIALLEGDVPGPDERVVGPSRGRCACPKATRCGRPTWEPCRVHQGLDRAMDLSRYPSDLR